MTTESAKSDEKPTAEQLAEEIVQQAEEHRAQAETTKMETDFRLQMQRLLVLETCEESRPNKTKHSLPTWRIGKTTLQ